MTIPVKVPVTTVAGTGAATPIPIDWQFNANAHLRVTRINADGTLTVLTLDTHYSVTGAGNPAGGTVTPLAPIASGTSWRIERRTPIEQPTDYDVGGAFPAESHEAALDRTIMIAQDGDGRLADLEGRALLVPIGETAPAFPKMSLRTDGALLGFAAGGALKVWDIGTANLLTIVGLADEIVAITAALDDISDVLTIQADIATVAGMAANVSTLAGVAGSIATVAGISGNITTVAGMASNITAVAGGLSSINAVAGALSNIGTVATNISGLSTLAANIGNVNTAVANLAAINAAPAAAETATTQAGIATAAAAAAVGAAEALNYFKSGVDVAATIDIPSLSGIQTIDGVAGQAGMSVLLAHQANAAENGIYTMASGAWVRRADADSGADLTSLAVAVRDGVTYRGRIFRSVAAVATVGTDPVIILPDMAGGSRLLSVARSLTGVYVHVGDSNTVGRTGTDCAYKTGRGHPLYGAWRNWTHFDFADSGMKLEAIVNTIDTGDRNAVPVDYDPAQSPGFGAPTASGGGGSNIWMIYNALQLHSVAVLEVSLGINDFGLCNSGTLTRPAPSAVPANFRRNLEIFLTFFLGIPGLEIILRIPQPFSGEADFITSGVNTTNWVYDSPNGTIAGGAAARSAEMIAEHRRWIGRHPRVHVVDMPKLVYGADRCDNSATNCLDPYIGTTFKGASVPNASRKLIEDSLHSSFLGEYREEQVMQQFLGLTPAPLKKADDYLIIGDDLPWEKIVAFQVVTFETLTNSGANTLMKIRKSPETDHWRSRLSDIVAPVGDVYSTRDKAAALAEAELRLRFGGMGKLGALRHWRNSVKVYFPSSGNTYAATAVRLSSETVDGTWLSDRFLQVQFDGVNMAAEETAMTGPDIGYSGAPREDKSRFLAIVYVEHIDDFFERRSFDVDVTGSGTARGDTYNRLPGDTTLWRSVTSHRASTSTTGFPTITATQSDGSGGAGNILNVTAVSAGTPLRVGCKVQQGGTTVTITALGTGTGGTGTYTVSGAAANVASTTWTVHPHITLSVSNQSDGRYVDYATTKTCSISGTTLTTPDATNLAIGQQVSGAGVAAGTMIVGGSGTSWTVNNSQTVGPVSMSFGVNAGTGNGYDVGYVNYGPGEKSGAWTPNTTNINNAIASLIGWRGASGVNAFTVKTGAYIQFTPNFTLPSGLTIAVTVAN